MHMSLDSELRKLSDSNVVSDEHEENSAKLSSEDIKLLLQQHKAEHLQLQNKLLRESIENEKQNRGQRKIFSYCLFGFMCLYMATALVITILSGFLIIYLSDTVLVALLTTTLADVIGVFAFVAKYLFHFKD